MILFNSDLDNTLIYSYHHDIGPDKRCVEVYNGRELSFMKPEWIETLKGIRKKLFLVPTTTRTLEQYNRISMGIGTPEYALVCNGGVLLRNGCADDGWYQESLALAAPARPELELAVKLLDQDPQRCFEIRFVEGLFVFTKSSDPVKSIMRLRENLRGASADIFSNGTKVYVVPKKLDKGTGVMRLKKALGADRVLAAGDSEFDKTMLLAADVGMCPEGLFQEQHSSVVQFPQNVFTSEVLKRVEELM